MVCVKTGNAAHAAFPVDPQGPELFHNYAYNHVFTKNKLLMAPKNTPLCLHLLLQSKLY